MSFFFHRRITFPSLNSYTLVGGESFFAVQEFQVRACVSTNGLCCRHRKIRTKVLCRQIQKRLRSAKSSHTETIFHQLEQKHLLSFRSEEKEPAHEISKRTNLRTK